MRHETLWGGHEAVPRFPTLDRDRKVSTLVVGAGITGLATARALQQRGHDVAIVELDKVGLGATGHSSGHLDLTTDTGMHAVTRTRS
jgi:phytoene dehydrogenase-like protein